MFFLSEFLGQVRDGVAPAAPSLLFWDVFFRAEFLGQVFLAALSVMLEDPGLSLIAWCLMSTHAHLLLSDETGALSSAMHGLATRYAGRFNSRTGHIGSVFAGRFKSVPVETDSQLVAAVRYIHNNPEKAGICPATEFAWSSYREYVGERGRR